jgi:hypothetical protein
MFDCAASGMDRLNQRQEAHVKAKDLVFGVIGNPNHLIGMQPGIQGMQDTPRAADTKIKL